jgi:DNA-binding transcriptional LysR family regulator
LLINLPIGPLRSLVTIADTGAIKTAAERVFLTQSALSLQMRRLEDIIQSPIFTRRGRSLVLTPSGQLLLSYAREILATNDHAVAALTGDEIEGPVRIGVVQDFADTLLSGLLARFMQLNPDAQINVTVGGSLELHSLVEAEQLDLALCIGPANSPDSFELAPMLWMGREALLDKEILPLALLTEPCIFRAAAIEALEAAGRSYRVLIETPSLSALRAAVESGIAITCRASHSLDDALNSIDQDAMPGLPSVSYVLHARTPLSTGIRRLYELMRATVSDSSAIVIDDDTKV